MVQRVLSDDALIAAHLQQARPRVVGALLRRFDDLELAEDGFQTAALRAAETWHRKGLPDDPVAWLVLVARNAVVDQLRKSVRDWPLNEDAEQPNEGPAPEEVLDKRAFQDDILRLLFLCCHPELKAQDQMILSLRYVLGLSVADIAKAFLLSKATLQRRLSRARGRAESLGGLADEAPRSRKSQLAQIQNALYLMFNKGYAASHGQPHVQPVLCREALRLTRLLLRVFPQEPATMGLLSLMLGLSARFPARLVDGQLVPLPDQDRSLWDQRLIAEARVLAQKAMRLAPRAALPLQAAICDIHNAAREPGQTDWAEIHRLYLTLEATNPTPVVTLNRLVAYSRVVGPEKALVLMTDLAGAMTGYLPFHAARAGLNEEVGRPDAALEATRAALNCSPSAEEKMYLDAQAARLSAVISGADHSG